MNKILHYGLIIGITGVGAASLGKWYGGSCESDAPAPTDAERQVMQVDENTSTPGILEVEGVSFVKAATVNGHEANRTLNKHISSYRSAKNQLDAMAKQYEAETDPERKQAIVNNYRAGENKLIQFDKAIQETYGFSLTKRYFVAVETSHVYVDAMQDTLRFPPKPEETSESSVKADVSADCDKMEDCKKSCCPVENKE
jgi:hypothetical protein